MDLTTTYMSLQLEHPIVASASPLSANLDTIKRLEDGGASAIVMASVFEEEIKRDSEIMSGLLKLGTHSYAESLSYFSENDACCIDVEDYFNLVRRAVEKVDVPIIASISCVSCESWVEYAKHAESAGARGVELNMYAVETDLNVLGSEVEQRYLSVLRAVKASIDIPVAIKLSPMFTAMGNMAKRLDQAGADALVLFNRFYQPDIDIGALEVFPYFDMSPVGDIRLPLLWVALLHGKINASLAATRGVEVPEDAIKYLLAGADAVMVASALLRNGPGYTATLIDGLVQWMDSRGFVSVRQLKGSMAPGNLANSQVFHHANRPRLIRETTAVAYG